MSYGGNPEKWQRIGTLVSVAATYADDGAPRTAAARLREAADLLDTIADANDAAIARALGPRSPVTSIGE